MTAAARPHSDAPADRAAMAAFTFGWRDLALILAVLIVLDLLCVAVLPFMDIGEVSRENGPIEAVQLAMLAFAFAIFLMIAARTAGVERGVAIAAAAIAAASFSREFRSPLDYATALDLLGSIPARTIVVIVLFILAGLAFFQDRARMPALLRWLARFPWWPFLLSMAFLVVGDYFEKLRHAPGFHWPFVEEVLELNGYAVFLVAAMLIWQRLAPAEGV